MRNTITRTAIAGLAALSLMGSLLATAEPAAAGGVHVGGGGGHVGGSTAAVVVSTAAASTVAVSTEAVVHGGDTQAVGTAVVGMVADGAARPLSADWRPEPCSQRLMPTATGTATAAADNMRRFMTPMAIISANSWSTAASEPPRSA